MKAGFVTIIGRSNVGKSTLLNALVGSKIAITTPKPQTTRAPIQGVVHDGRGQIVLVDTPGIMQRARDPLTKKLRQVVEDSMNGIDLLCYVVDPTRSIGNEEHQALQLLEKVNVPKLLVINKIDLADKPFIEDYRLMSDQFDQVIEVSAARGSNLNLLKDAIFERLPEGQALYPPEQLTNLPREAWLSELIREKLFLRLRQEVPYSVHVEVRSIKEQKDGALKIAATVFTDRERYKQMIIGAGGQGIKEISQAVRNELQTVADRKVTVDLRVEHDPHWLERI